MRIIFNIRSDVRDFVNEHIKPLHGTCDDALLKEKMQAKDVNISIRNMANAMLVAHEFLEENKSDIIGYLSYFLNKVLMIYVATEELQDAFQLFTVLNNRGVKLSSSDILKAENLKELSAADRTSWATRWEEMETYFGEDFDKFLSHIRTILVIPIRNMTAHRKNMSPELQSCAEGRIPSSCFILIIIHIRRYLIRIILW